LLEVVKHHVRYKGKVWKRTKSMSIHMQDSQGSDCVCQKCTIVQSLHAQTVRSHANVMLLLLFLVFTAGVLLEYMKAFSPFFCNPSMVEQSSQL
jgi:hypothetical protein